MNTKIAINADATMSEGTKALAEVVRSSASGTKCPKAILLTHYAN